MTVEKDLLQALLSSGAVVSVALRAEIEGTVLPPDCMGKVVVLDLGYDMPVPIPDLSLDDEGFRGTLSFSQEAVKVFVPWQAVFAFTDEAANTQVVFRDRVPEEMPSRPPPRSVGGGLRTVKGGDA